ncbi:hypothetical protein Pan153_46200 [Gimesia panareensis]|uniref:Uncharacterized protein n=1 Tax=Gimesia panareensis TaxID=2527978 RepID=A0A518FUD3_9PLAN|nr:hypothetical protein [Gimesia panareensis]QDV19951.1 hypothetical protein Pan153_46200 [Gimesia panareensis]
MSNDITPDEQNTNPNETPCPLCNEMVRVGLVRCWNCGSFMREDIAEAYRKMQENPAPMIFSPLPEDSDESAEEESRGSTATMTAYADRDDDDFELDQSVSVTEYEASDDDFQLAGGVEVSQEDQSTIPLAREESVEEAKQHAEEDQAASKEEDAAAAEDKKKDVSAEPAEDHSVATGGDVLLNVAMEEEKEEKRRRKGGRRRRRGSKIEGGIVVYCPNGHRIRVREEYRGAAGKCPACNVMYLVPMGTPKQAESESAGAATDENQAAEGTETFDPGTYSHWFQNIKLHAVDPTKLKLKPNSLEKAFTTVDVAISPEKMLLLGLVKAGLLGGGSKDKQDKARIEIAQHLREEKEDAEIPAASVQTISAEQIQKLRVVFPTMYDHESVFAGVPVFGKGRIAIALPKQEDIKENQYLTFSLTEYRKFAEALQELHGVSDLGQDSGIPMTDEVRQVTCHYSEEKFDVLENENLEFYEADPEIELTLVGRQCQGCQLTVSEDSRKKERIGGKTGKGIAKAKCPKCNEKFGNISLWQIKQADEVAAEAPQEEAAAE